MYVQRLLSFRSLLLSVKPSTIKKTVPGIPSILLHSAETVRSINTSNASHSFIKPWPNIKTQRLIAAITKTQEKRKKRFEEVKTRVNKQDVSIRDHILSLSLLQLKDALQKDKLNAQTVLMAYAWKALQVQEAFNCITEFLIESFDEAERLDKQYSGIIRKPPLYGIPFSVKSCFFLEGYDCTGGLAQGLGFPKKENCSFVNCLRSLGAVPFVYTNVPQLLVSFVCSNPIFGTTVHPMNSLRTPGGTSGGEACLLASGGTPFGTGNDLAGSLRIPANFCGLIAMKATETRYLVKNTLRPPGWFKRLGYGFFTKSVDEQVFLWQSLLGAQENYASAVPENSLKTPFKVVKFKETVKKRNLKIGYFSYDGFLKATPGCERVVHETVSRLREQGHELVQFRVPSVDRVASLLFRGLLPEGGVYFSKLLSDDIVDPNMKEISLFLKIPFFVRSLISFILPYLSPQAAILFGAHIQKTKDVNQVMVEWDNYLKQFTNLWKELNIDALICPAFTVPPVPHELVGRLGPCAFSTVLFTLLDYPAGVVPTGKVTEKDDSDLIDESKWPTNNNFVLKAMRDASVNSEGLPLAVQVVALPHQEETCLGVMKVIEDLWK